MSVADKATALEALAATMPTGAVQKAMFQLSTIKAMVAGILGTGSDTDELCAAVDTASRAFEATGAAYETVAAKMIERAAYHRAKMSIGEQTARLEALTQSLPYQQIFYIATKDERIQGEVYDIFSAGSSHIDPLLEAAGGTLNAAQQALDDLAALFLLVAGRHTHG